MVAAALSLTHVLAFDAGSSGTRSQGSDVASDAAAFVTLANLGPSAALPVLLENHNDYQADALQATNAYSTDLVLQASLTVNPQGRFAIANPTSTVAPGAQHTFQIVDTDNTHKKLCASVVVSVDAYIGGTGTARQGHAVVARQVFVQVRPIC